MNDRQYTRWRRDDGFRWVDLEDVLFTSPFILSVDWREYLPDAIQVIQSNLACFDVRLVADMDEAEPQGSIAIEGKVEPVRYVPSEHDADFNQVVGAVNRLLEGLGLEYRLFNTTVGSDGWTYAVLTLGQWRELKDKVPEAVDMIFRSVDS